MYHEGHWCAAKIDPSLRQVDAMERNAAFLSQKLESLGVPYAFVPSVTTHRLRIAVPASHRTRVLRHLSSGDDATLHLRLAAARWPWFGMPAVRRPRRRRLRRTNEIRVYQSFTDPTGSVVFGSLPGCSLEFWRESRDGVLSTTLGDTRIGTATRDEFGNATIVMASVRVRTLPAVAEKQIFSSQTFPVDLVYTWVDGDDPRWLARKREVSARLQPGRLAQDSNLPHRFTHRDELKYSLRSVSQFAEFVRHVYVVTDQQVPEWLDLSCPRLTLVDHRDIFVDPACLPTFNSHAIESQLHHIDGLSEHFLYMNDDFMFGRRVMHTNFFHPNGIAKFFMSTAVLAGQSLGVDHAAGNAADLLESEFGIRVTNKMKHAPYALRRSALASMEERFPDAFARTARSQLRGSDDISVASFMGHYYACFTGVAVPGTIVSAYVDIGRSGIEAQLARILALRRYDSICLNEGGTDSVHQAERDVAVKEWLSRYFPTPSEFEKG